MVALPAELGHVTFFTLNSTLLLLQDRCYRSWCQSVFPGSALPETSSLFSRWRWTTSSSLSLCRNGRNVNTEISPAVKRCIKAAGVWSKNEERKVRNDTLAHLTVQIWGSDVGCLSHYDSTFNQVSHTVRETSGQVSRWRIKIHFHPLYPFAFLVQTVRLNSSC